MRLLLALAVMAASGPIPAGAAFAAETATVVELFTSQGCSSCPPADAELRRLSKEPNIIALSLHVNYWDYIGWKDPFASAETTERQHHYADTLHQRYVYTPEMVVDGFTDLTGTDGGSVDSAISGARKRDRLRLPVTAKADGGKLTVSIPAAPEGRKAAVWLFEFDREHVTAVMRGENSGKSLTNANVVRSLKRIGEWNGQAVELTADLSDDRDGCAIIVQSGEAGPVLGATAISLR